MKTVSWSLVVVLSCAAALPAQSAGSGHGSDRTIHQTVMQIPENPSISPESNASQPPIMNILTVIGENALGVPCLDCLLGILIPSLGLPKPLGKALAGSKYQIDSYLIDNTYNGACAFTLAVTDSHNNIIASVQQTLNETAGHEILLTTPITIPTNAGIGLGSVSNTAVCGANVSQSKSPVLLACVNNPPFCVN